MKCKFTNKNKLNHTQERNNTFSNKIFYRIVQSFTKSKRFNQIKKIMQERKHKIARFFKYTRKSVD